MDRGRYFDFERSCFSQELNKGKNCRDKDTGGKKTGEIRT